MLRLFVEYFPVLFRRVCFAKSSSTLLPLGPAWARATRDALLFIESLYFCFLRPAGHLAGDDGLWSLYSYLQHSMWHDVRSTGRKMPVPVKMSHFSGGPELSGCL